MSDQTGWVEDASADNAETTATKAAVSGKSHVVFSVDASFTSAATKLLQIKDGTTVVWSGMVYSSREVRFPKGLTITRSAACSAVLAASGAGGNTGYVNLHGVTRAA